MVMIPPSLRPPARPLTIGQMRPPIITEPYPQLTQQQLIQLSEQARIKLASEQKAEIQSRIDLYKSRAEEQFARGTKRGEERGQDYMERVYGYQKALNYATGQYSTGSLTTYAHDLTFASLQALEMKRTIKQAPTTSKEAYESYVKTLIPSQRKLMPLASQLFPVSVTPEVMGIPSGYEPSITIPPGFSTVEMERIFTKYQRELGIKDLTYEASQRILQDPSYQKEISAITFQPKVQEKMVEYAKRRDLPSPERYGKVYYKKPRFEGELYPGAILPSREVIHREEIGTTMGLFVPPEMVRKRREEELARTYEEMKARPFEEKYPTLFSWGKWRERESGYLPSIPGTISEGLLWFGDELQKPVEKHIPLELKAPHKTASQLAYMPGYIILWKFFSPAFTSIKVKKGKAKLKVIKKTKKVAVKDIKDIEINIREAWLRGERNLVREAYRKALKSGNKAWIRDTESMLRNSLGDQTANTIIKDIRLQEGVTAYKVAPGVSAEIFGMPPTARVGEITPSVWAGTGLYEKALTPEEQFLVGREAYLRSRTGGVADVIFDGVDTKAFPGYAPEPGRFAGTEPGENKFAIISKLAGKFKPMEAEAPSPRIEEKEYEGVRILSGLRLKPEEKVKEAQTPGALLFSGMAQPQAPRLKEPLAPKLFQPSILKQPPRLREPEKLKEPLRERPGLIIPTIPKPPKIKKPGIPVIPFWFPGERPVYKKENRTQYDVFALKEGSKPRKSKWLKLNTEPQSLQSGRDLGAKHTDEQISARFKLTPQKTSRVVEGKKKIFSKSFPKTKSLPRGDNYFNLTSHKFRPYRVVKGKKVMMKNEYVEKAHFRLDHPKEVRTIHTAKRRASISPIFNFNASSSRFSNKKSRRRPRPFRL